MNGDETDGDETERDLTPEEEAEVSSVLSGLAGPLPTPPDVVARVEETLADLRVGAAGTRAATAPSAPGRPPAGVSSPHPVRTVPPRRRRWPRVLLAAAAVVVGGYSVGNLLTSGVMSGSDTAGEAGTDSAVPGASGGGGGGGAGEESAQDELGARLPTRVPGVTLGARDFAADVRRELPRLRAAADGSAGAAARCTVPPLDRRDQWYLVQFEGQAASLVLNRTSGGTLEASAFSCRSAAELARADLRPAE